MANRYDTWIGNFELNPAEGITPAAKKTFSNGQCHSLAVALHDVTGWPLFAIQGISGTRRSPEHVFVQSPQGFLDISGLEANKPYWGEPFEVTRQEILEFRSYKPCDPENAMPFAMLVLERFNAQHPQRGD